MKSLYKYLFLIFTAVSITSCDTDTLNIEQLGVMPTTIYQTAADDQTNGFIAAVYSKIRGDGYVVLMDIGTCYNGIRNNLARMGGELGEYYQYAETSDANTYKYIWSYYYTLAYWSNMIIENLPGNDVASPELKARVIAEARTIRAIAMMNLVQLFGNPPLADHILDGSEGNTPATDSWNFIEKELSEAAEGLPSKSGLNGQAAIGGRLTKEAAYAYLGRAYLWEKKYNEAAQTLYNKVISTGLYELITDFKLLNSSASDFCSEYVWEFDFSEASGYELSQEGLFDLGVFGIQSGTGGIKMPAEFRQSMCFGYGGCPSSSFGEFMGNHDKLSNGTQSNRYSGTVATYEDLLNNYTYSSDDSKGIDASVDNCQGYFRIKEQALADDVTGNTSNFAYEFSKKNLCYMRYAEVLLNYAEAVANGGTQGSSLSGLQALNLIRRRAGLSDAPDLEMNNAQYGVKAERRAELFYEGTRFIDLVRWGDAAAELAECGKLTYTFHGYKSGSNTTPQTPDQWNIISSPTVGQGFKEGKNELFPIPLVDINRNPAGLIQNPEW
jgi:hypothetical protein